MRYFRKIAVTAIVAAFWFAPLASADKLDTEFAEKSYNDEANEEFVAQESLDLNAATPFSAEKEEYWTKERMMNAMSYPLPELDGEPMDTDIQSKDSELFEGKISESSLSLADKANKKKRPSVLNEEKDAVAIAGGDVATLPYPPPHSFFFVPTYKYTWYPYKTVGKVFFTSGGYNYSCSGSSGGGRAVLTAGHCISNGRGTWHSNWRFVPAYRNGAAPYGIWYAFWKSTFTSWHYSGNLCRDVGYAAVRDKNGYKLSQTVGNPGFAWNQPYNLYWDMFGYPAASPYNGRWMVQTNALFSRSDDPNCSGPRTVGIGTNQTGGTSGGPRLYRFNYANGVNSYIYRSRPLEMFSPYFDTSVNNLRVNAISQ